MTAIYEASKIFDRTEMSALYGGTMFRSLPDSFGDTFYAIKPVKTLTFVSFYPDGWEGSDVSKFSLSTSGDINTLLRQALTEYVREIFPEFEKTFVAAAKNTFIESGGVYEFEEIFENYRRTNAMAAPPMLSQLLREHYGEIPIVKAVLHTISHYSYSELGREFVFHLDSLCYHKDRGIKKFALKVFDNWNAVETLKILKNKEPIKENWLETYRKKIINNLESLKGEPPNVVSDSGN